MTIIRYKLQTKKQLIRELVKYWPIGLWSINGNQGCWKWFFY